MFLFRFRLKSLKDCAKKHLVEWDNRLLNEHSEEPQNEAAAGTPEAPPEYQPSQYESPLENLLRTFESEQHLNNVQREKSFDTLLEEFEKEPRLGINEDILKYWRAQRNGSWHRLAAISDVIYSTPPTQVTVERCFSTFRFILNDQRTRLSDSNLENILLLKTNSNFEMNCDIRFDSLDESESE